MPSSWPGSARRATTCASPGPARAHAIGANNFISSDCREAISEWAPLAHSPWFTGSTKANIAEVCRCLDSLAKLVDLFNKASMVASDEVGMEPPTIIGIPTATDIVAETLQVDNLVRVGKLMGDLDLRIAQQSGAVIAAAAKL